MNLWKRDKSRKSYVKFCLNSIERGTPTPIAANELFDAARVLIEIAEHLRKQQQILNR